MSHKMQNTGNERLHIGRRYGYMANALGYPGGRTTPGALVEEDVRSWTSVWGTR